MRIPEMLTFKVNSTKLVLSLMYVSSSVQFEFLLLACSVELICPSLTVEPALHSTFTRNFITSRDMRVIIPMDSFALLATSVSRRCT